ncbi:Amino acid transporter [Caligus rogercresseyi]|uniref:Amino acid transporter n=1 Tax=Caligus rogercresseyi TaxID=217165 RepID=A0A7T8HJH4_CALRO|nr:Amino acid transporter [Caligus rogercresseyi]
MSSISHLCDPKHGIISSQGSSELPKAKLLDLLTLGGVILGVVVGVSVRSSQDETMSPREVMYVSFIGDIFLRMLKSIIIPLIIPSLIVSIGSWISRTALGSGAWRCSITLSRLFWPFILGITLVVTIQPGHGTDQASPGTLKGYLQKRYDRDTLMDLIRNCFPSNILLGLLSLPENNLILLYC